MKHIRTFKEQADYYEGETSSAPMQPAKKDCPNCGNEINVMFYELGPEPITCEFCGSKIEYPWGQSWRWA